MQNSNYNRVANIRNPFQGSIKKVLCVCSAGLLRSPTAAVVLSQKPFGFNTRAAGIAEEYALIPVDDVLLMWADQIVCMDEKQKKLLVEKLTELNLNKPIICLNIPDIYGYRQKELIKLIKSRYNLNCTPKV